MEQLIEAFLAALEDAGITAVRQMPLELLPRLTAPVTAVGLTEAKGLEQAFYEYLGLLEHQGNLCPLYGRKLEAQVRLLVCCPRRLGAARCMQEADTVCTLLSGQLPGIGLSGFRLGECRYEAESDLFTCAVTAEAAAYLYALTNEYETEFTDFILKGVPT